MGLLLVTNSYEERREDNLLNRTLKEALRNHAAEFDRLESKKDGYRNNGALNDYLAAIDEFEEAADRGDHLEEAFNGTFASSGALYKFLLPAFKKYAEPSKAKLPPKDFVAYLASIGESNEIN